MKIRPVILSGGSGTRLWPVSRRSFPKQFAPLVGEQSLFATALELVSDRKRFEAPMIVGNAEHKFLILDALELARVKDAKILLEPEGRNTAAAAITAAMAEEDKGVLHLVMPSDHVILDAAAFMAAIDAAAEAASKDNIVLFGMNPTHPETGYGYIKPGEKADWAGVFRIEAFREKPDAAGAEALIKSGALWNGGMFLYSPALLIKEANELAPAYTPLCKEALTLGKSDFGCIMLAADAYAKIASEPFDRLIMERTKKGCVVPCSIKWSDAGSWQALWQMGDRDGEGNSFTGPVVSHDVKDTFVRSDGPMVAVVGVADITVVATRDAVLVTPRHRSQDVKTIVAEIERQHPEVAAHHTRVNRPWGTYESLAQGTNFQVKHIVVQPGRQLSLQKHHHRAEHWVVVGGTARVERDGVEELVFPNESVYVPRGTVHRMTNPGKVPLHLIEVQSGDYLGEDDIIRLDDPYGRTSEPAPLGQGNKKLKV